MLENHRVKMHEIAEIVDNWTSLHVIRKFEYEKAVPKMDVL